MTSVPYPTFDTTKPVGSSLEAVGRCRIHCNNGDDDEAYREIVAKCVQQGSVNNTKGGDGVAEKDDAAAKKKLQKKYMKQGMSMASDYLNSRLQLDVTVIDVEVLLRSSADVIATSGCLASCFLDAGCARIVLPYHRDDTSFQEAADIAGIPRERLMVHVEMDSATSVIDDLPSIVDKVRSVVGAVSVLVDGKDDKLQKTLASVLSTSAKEKENEERVDIVAQFRPSSNVGDDEAFAEMIGTTLSKSTSSDSSSGTTISIIDPTAQQLGLSYAACLKTDRPDGLYSTVVCTRSGEALGLVYSSPQSIVAALQCGRGVYYSRSRQGLWRKGDTSGHHQTLHRLDVDCDGDALRFTVTQQCSSEDQAASFCHLNTLTCWGAPRGLRHLEETVNERLKSAPEGSYTKRLFDDDALLQEKLVEEAQELSEAETPQHVAEELADVLYFAMVRAAKAGVSIDDAATELDRRTRKVTRRKGDSKAFRIEAGKAILDRAKETK